ncbi:hypothetical protein [Mesorhizobium sp.]|uniref:hypothetical protein n=1 Tax=Mesorhizobium sp. TaxID=1871066 RepID=UPI0025F63E2B|nr:hypothetical protein [Mesorhizobium sp.]
MAGIDGELLLRRNQVPREDLARHKPRWALAGNNRLGDESGNCGNLDQHGGEGDLLQHARKRSSMFPVPHAFRFSARYGTRDRQGG